MIEALLFIATFFALCLIFHLVTPARSVEGYVCDVKTQKPLSYRLNGVRVWLLTVATFLLLSNFGYFSQGTFLIDNFWSCCFFSNLIGLIFSSLLYIRGKRIPKKHRETQRRALTVDQVTKKHNDTPSTESQNKYIDQGFLVDFFSGLEFNPRPFQTIALDLKMYLYMAGALLLQCILLSAVFKHYQLFSAISFEMKLYVGILSFWVLEYLYHEHVHLYTYDFFAERLGFKLTWGCFCFYPFFYTIGMWPLIFSPPSSSSSISPLLALLSILIFLTGYILSRGANNQKYVFKKNPHAVFLGFIRPKTVPGTQILCSGFWGLSRHINYLGEILMAIALAIPGGVMSRCTGWICLLPWLYPLYYVALLFPREKEDSRVFSGPDVNSLEDIKLVQPDVPTEDLDLDLDEDEENSLPAKSSGTLADRNPQEETLSYEEIISRLGFGRFQWKLAVLCGMSWCTEAMEVLLLSLLIPVISDEWDLSNWEAAAIAAVMFFGQYCGSYCWGWVSDRFGRRLGFMCGAAFTAFFGLASSFAPDLYSLLALRGLVGFGISSGHVPYSLFAEYLPKTVRGAPLVYFELFWSVGGLFEVGLAWLTLPTLGWRWTLALTAAPLFVVLLAWPFVPESSRYLLVKGRYSEAVEQLRSVARHNRVKLPETLHLHASLPEDEGKDDEEIEEKKAVKGERKMKKKGRAGQCRDLLSPEWRRTSLLVWFLWGANNLAYFGVIFFTPEYFRVSDESSSSEEDPQDNEVYLSVLLTMAAELPGLIGAALLIDRWGRKKLGSVTWFGFGLCTLGLLVPVEWFGVGLAFAIGGRMCAVATFAVIWVYTPEVYPTVIRSTAMGVATSFAKIAAIGTPFVGLVLPSFSEVGPIFVFAGVAFVSATVWLLLPIETAGKKLADTL